MTRIIRSIWPISLKKSLVQLQDKLYWLDFRPRRGVAGSEIYIAARLVKNLQHIRIRMDGKNHKRPHVYVDYGKEYPTATYAIDSGERISGELDRKYDQEVRAWIISCRPQLLKAWKRIQAGQNADVVICELRAA